MSAGDGYEYLLRSVVAGDGDRSLSTPLTRYYEETGTPPGYWLGSGVHAFGDGQLAPGATVGEDQLALLLGQGRDPLTGDQLGRAFPKYQSVADRITARVAELDSGLSGEERDVEVARIEAEETEKGKNRAVAGYDFTFSVPKSVSVLWGVGDAGTQEMLVEAHHAAVAEVVAFLEREVAATRAGVAARDGAVAQVDVAGIAATAYDHWDSRCGDPQLHTHVVISNKVKTLLDGKWRSLDSRPMHASVVALSEHYNAVLADRLTGTFGLEWERRARGEDRNPSWEIVGVPDRLVTEFSSRGRAIEIEKDRRIAEYVARYGRQPSRTTVIKLRAQATLATRPEKHVHSLAELTGAWRSRAARLLDEDPTQWARNLTTGPLSGSAPQVLRASDVPLDLIGDVGSRVVSAVSEKRATWRHWNLWAEAARQTMGWRFASVEDREAITAMIVESAEGCSIALTPGEVALSPAEFRREDGTSVFRPRHSVVYSSLETLAAEDRLLIGAEDRNAAVVPAKVVRAVAVRPADRQQLSDQQTVALTAIATSGRRIDLLVGPAGAGKTTAMRALRGAWSTEHGTNSVVGLAPSAAAAQVLADDIGIACENTAKWLHEYDNHRAGFAKDQLVIVDEASLASTRTLDRLAAIAAEAGAKLLLVGDWAQLQSVDAGGAFALLASARDDTPELRDIHRFTHEWEKTASLDLRDGRVEAIGTYSREKRLREGTTDEMIDAAYLAWRADSQAGLASVLVTESSQAVAALNARARAERILDGETDATREAVLAEGARASVGDLVITRQNDRRIRSLRGGWVRNGDRWKVTDVRPDGTLVVRRQGLRWAATVALPTDYVAEHVDLGYAITAHRAQGITVDTAHVVVSATTTRENLYVSMTRGRDANIAYVALDTPDDSHAAPHPDDVNARTVLYGVLQHSGVDLSAHQMIEAEQEAKTSIAQIGAEYDTIAAAAQRDRWTRLMRASNLTPEDVEAVLTSDAFGPLTAALRRAEAIGRDVDQLLPKLVARRSLDGAVDAAAVLQHRVEIVAKQPPGGRRRKTPALIAGLIPEAQGDMTPEMRTALDERRELIETRAHELAERAVAEHAPWLNKLGRPPVGERERRRWLQHVATVAAYRDRYGVTTVSTLGPQPQTETQRNDAARARSAAERASQIARNTSPQATTSASRTIGL
ncbi:MobF family relaxase [Nocardioides sp.]|uniref:MobF family relaxase n=1 Tax=Nocardioides sp. TaxID=35761 RepID=UPI003D0A90B5